MQLQGQSFLRDQLVVLLGERRCETQVAIVATKFFGSSFVDFVNN